MRSYRCEWCRIRTLPLCKLVVEMLHCLIFKSGDFTLTVEKFLFLLFCYQETLDSRPSFSPFALRFLWVLRLIPIALFRLNVCALTSHETLFRHFPEKFLRMWSCLRAWPSTDEFLNEVPVLSKLYQALKEFSMLFIRPLARVVLAFYLLRNFILLSLMVLRDRLLLS